MGTSRALTDDQVQNFADRAKAWYRDKNHYAKLAVLDTIDVFKIKSGEGNVRNVDESMCARYNTAARSFGV